MLLMLVTAVMTSSLVDSQSYFTALRERYLPHRKFVTSDIDKIPFSALLLMEHSKSVGY